MALATFEGSQTALRRLAMVLCATSLTVAASFMFATVVQADGFDWLDVVRITLMAIAAFWLAWGGCIAFFGILFPDESHPRSGPVPEGRTAVLLPIYNEATGPVFARLAAIMRSVGQLKAADQFDFFVLSDTTRLEVAEKERQAYEALLAQEGAGGRLFYRRREKNIGRKAGNIADFVTTSGGAYEYMLVLDADSLMEGETILEMVRRMEADPRLGLLQSLPRIIGLDTLFGRLLQFATSLYGPYFARGLAAVQGGEGSFWGHNALIRTRAFAASCGMAPLQGEPPFGGHILSHDTIEAALLARDGWTVRLDPDLTGSYEEAPANMVDYAKRDRRWCQGNLQHGRVLVAPRFRFWSRLAILQGIFAYLASPIWFLFLIASLAAPLAAPAPVYFDGHSPFPVFPHPETATALALLFGLVALLILPKLLLAIRALADGSTAEFGGPLRLLVSFLLETVLTSMLAPLHMMFTCRSVVQVLTGADSGWPAAERDDGSLSFATSLSATWWIVVTGVAGILFSNYFVPELFYWLLPVAVPMALAPVLIWSTASVSLGKATARIGLFAVPADQKPVAVAAEMHNVLNAAATEPAPALVSEAIA
ncbi:glucans biosynthesis glucosyltransferase MdoH [Roseibium aggregatum]|uniref:Glucans biosynthesis glucosyltransferase H n=1 Tax=Roseibium aggregatum TaxID=187304 RepID=A0A939EFL2_9HYPH|nr:glucans biosynthesis glucosyltransferase MdoH [Roseibium aggregatum]MBN9671572.1 glucans biosynthesis glucosyltransferase MdoH [Roseibium aggregatum]